MATALGALARLLVSTCIARQHAVHETTLPTCVSVPLGWQEPGTVSWKYHTVSIARPSRGPGHLPAHNTTTDRINAAIMQISARIISARGEIKKFAMCPILVSALQLNRLWSFRRFESSTTSRATSPFIRKSLPIGYCTPLPMTLSRLGLTR
jgi:hypothetical protein